MKLVKLGDYIEQCDAKNSKNEYGEDAVKGIATSKKLIETKANLDGVALSSYKLVKPLEFAFVPDTSRRGDKMSLGFNTNTKVCIVSSISCVFRVKNHEELLPEYLYLWFCRSEFDRYTRFNSWGSAREAFSYDEMSRIKIPLPDIDEQKKIVAVWNGLKNLKEENERFADPLLALCQSYLEGLRKEYKAVKIGPYIKLSDETNSDNNNYQVIGINKDKEFMPTVANVENIDKKKYKIVCNKRFVFSGMQTGRDECIRIALYEDDTPALISPAYTTFTVKEEKGLLSEFLFLCFKRKEMDRYGWFISDSSVRANLDWPRFLDIKVPLPPIDKQKAIVEIYKCAQESRQIANIADKLNNDICPALMQQVIGA